MSKKFIIVLTFCTVLLFSLFALINISKIQNIGNSYKKEMINEQYYTIKALIPQIRHLLIIGNFREAHKILSHWQAAGLYLRFDLLQDQFKSNLSDNQIQIPIYFSEGGEAWGSIIFDLDTYTTEKYSDQINLQLLINALGTLLLLFILTTIVISIFWRTSKRLTTIINSYLNDYPVTDDLTLQIVWGPLLMEMRKITSLSNEIKNTKNQIMLAEKINLITKQVSHDIRSPLAALKVALEDISTLPEKNRLILKMSIQRIQDIANNLLKNSQENESPKIAPNLLYPLLEEILSEKRIQYKSLSNVTISGSLKLKSQMFAEINPILIKQIISNLINNSVEAMDKNHGLIELKLFQEGDQAIIEITDNGKGIPDEIVNELGVKNITYGKEVSQTSGFGIGVKHAFDTIKTWNGTITILSQVRVGSTFRISLPLAPTPAWFVKEITLNPNHSILILDDDQEIHQVWDKKLEQFQLPRYHFYNSTRLREWIAKNPNTDFLLLSDHELIGESTTGLELIEQLGIQERSILATSHYQDIVKLNSSIKVIPKNLVFDLNFVLVEHELA